MSEEQVQGTTITPPGGPEGQAGTGSAGTINPAMEKRLSDENAKLRIQNREIREQMAQIQEQLSTLAKSREAEPSHAPAAPASRDQVAAELAQLKRAHLEAQEKLNALQGEMKSTTERAKAKILRAGLSKALADARVLEADTASRLLESLGARVADDDAVEVPIKGEDGEEKFLAVTAETLRRVLPGIYFPASGVSGSGSGPTSAKGAGLDMERAKRDPKYYAENRDAILRFIGGKS